jgi:hypothetical protein
VAREVEGEYNAEMDRLRDEWFETHPDGAFKAHRQKEPDDLRPRAKAAAKHRKRKRAAPELQPGNMADVDGATFVVFNIFAHPTTGNLVVAYYEAEALEQLECASFQTLRDLDTTHEQDLCLRAGEHVSVADYQEVMTWVLDSDPVDSRHHIPGLSPTLCCDDAITEVDAPAAAKEKAVKRKRPVKNTRKWVADVPGIALVGEFFVDPLEEGQVSLGLCHVVPRPKRFATTTTQTFYKEYRCAANNRKQPERSLTKEVEQWVRDSAGAISILRKCFATSSNFKPDLSAVFRGWWKVTVCNSKFSGPQSTRSNWQCKGVGVAASASGSPAAST